MVTEVKETMDIQKSFYVHIAVRWFTAGFHLMSGYVNKHVISKFCKTLSYICMSVNTLHNMF